MIGTLLEEDGGEVSGGVFGVDRGCGDSRCGDGQTNDVRASPSVCSKVGEEDSGKNTIYLIQYIC